MVKLSYIPANIYALLPAAFMSLLTSDLYPPEQGCINIISAIIIILISHVLRGNSFKQFVLIGWWQLWSWIDPRFESVESCNWEVRRCTPNPRRRGLSVWLSGYLVTGRIKQNLSQKSNLFLRVSGAKNVSSLSHSFFSQYGTDQESSAVYKHDNFMNDWI